MVCTEKIGRIRNVEKWGAGIVTIWDEMCVCSYVGKKGFWSTWHSCNSK